MPHAPRHPLRRHSRESGNPEAPTTHAHSLSRSSRRKSGPRGGLSRCVNPWLPTYVGRSGDELKCRTAVVRNCRTTKSHPKQSQRPTRPKCRTEPPRIYGAQNRHILQAHLTTGGLGDVQLKTSGRWPAWPRRVGDSTVPLQANREGLTSRTGESNGAALPPGSKPEGPGVGP